MESSRHVARTGVWSRGPAPGAEEQLSRRTRPSPSSGTANGPARRGQAHGNVSWGAIPRSQQRARAPPLLACEVTLSRPCARRRPRPSRHAQQEGPGRTALQTRATSPHCHLPAPPTPASTHAGRRLGRLLLRIELGGDLLRNQRLAELHTSGGERRHAGAPGSVSRCNVFSSSSR